MRDQAVAQVDGVAQRFHRKCALLKPGEIEEIGDRAQANDEVIVRQLVVMMIESVRDAYQLRSQIYGFNLSRKKTDAPEELSHGIHNIRQVQIAGRHFVQHRGEQEEVVPVHQSDLTTRITGQSVVQMNGGVKPGKAAAQNDDASFLLRRH